MIGVFDSGLGGLTVVRRLRARLPSADIVFLADQKNVPYGDRRDDELAMLLAAHVAWLDAQGVDPIVMGCNTSCAIADRFGWPPARAEMFDLIDAATLALQRTGAQRIGVLATAATVRSGAYGRRIRNAIPGCEVWEVAAPALVPLVEAGRIDDPQTTEAVRAVCEQLPSALDAVVLACTHYPILDRHFAVTLGEDVVRIDPAEVQAERVWERLTRDGMLDEGGRTTYATNGDGRRFRENVIKITGEVTPVIQALSTVEPI